MFRQARADEETAVFNLDAASEIPDRRSDLGAKEPRARAKLWERLARNLRDQGANEAGEHYDAAHGTSVSTAQAASCLSPMSTQAVSLKINSSWSKAL